MNIAHFTGSAGEAEDRTTTREVDVMALGVVSASILMFIGTGAAIAPKVMDSMLGRGPAPEPWMLNAFLLNIAIIIFGWARYRQLCEEIRVRREAELQARQLAETDPLTGFLNRRSFHNLVDRLRADAARRGNSVVLMMIDLDKFKQVNDHHGHGVGDLLLCDCSRRMKGNLPANTLIGRVGGDEFAVALEYDPAVPETVDEIASRMIDVVAQSAKVGALSIEVTASIGLASTEVGRARLADSVVDSRSLLEMADIAMYHSKRQGRNTYSWFEAQMAEEMRMRSELERGIRQGIAKGEFVPFYERQMDLRTGELTGFEMLARWDSPQFGIVSPEIFIPVAEEIGAIAELSERLIAQALEDAKAWDPHLTLSVNISPIQMRDPWFSQKLLRLLIEANFPPHRLEIEITESCLHENVAQVRALVTSLKNQGVRISLDDFGTGYSSLAQLRSLPFDRIKIDRSFVSKAAESKDSAAIVHAIAMLGKGLSLPVTAEGIESGEILKHLRQYDQLTGQGYLYGQPRRAGDLEDWLGHAKPQPATAEPERDSKPEMEEKRARG